MSHIVTIPAQFNDLATLKAAAESLGLTFNIGQTKMFWYGKFMNDYHGKDAAFNQGIPVEDYGKAQHTITVPDSEYNIGVIKDLKGDYRVYWDSYGRNGKRICEKIGRQAEKLKVAYATQKAISFAKSKGWDYTVNTLPNGNQTVDIQTR